MNMILIFVNLGTTSEGTQGSIVGIRKHIVALHNLIKHFMNPFLFLIYMSLHLISILLLATSAERLAKIICLEGRTKESNPKNEKERKEEEKRGIARINTFGFFLETLPQIVCQSCFLAITGANTTAIVSLSISSYRTVSSYFFKVFLCCFPEANLQDSVADVHATQLSVRVDDIDERIARLRLELEDLRRRQLIALVHAADQERRPAYGV
jgi:hypothetical protein